MGTTQPSFEIAAETLSELTRVGISATTVWRHHAEVTGQIETELEREEREVPPFVMVMVPGVVSEPPSILSCALVPIVPPVGLSDDPGARRR